MNVIPARLFSTLIAFALGASAFAQEPFAPLDARVLDKTAFAQWVAGAETALTDAPQAAVWTRQSKPDFRGAKFGAGREAGPRHLRVGFTEPVAVGSVLVSGGGSLSVLKPDAAYPGDLANDAQWLPAERLLEGEAARREVGEGAYGWWVLPPGTKTRALRFSHLPAPGDRETAGMLGGVWVLPERLGNVAPQAFVQSRARDDASAKLVDGSSNHTWQAWDNGEQGAALPVSPEHPEIVTFTWPKPVKLGGVCLLWTGFQACEIDAFTGADDLTPREAPETSWRRVGTGRDMDSLYPLQLGPHWIAFESEVPTRALRLRITGGAKASHPHLESKVKEGRRVWLGELLALAPMKDAALTSLVLPKAAEEPPPIPVKFTLPEPGVVTLVIEDLENHRVRNLVSETPFPAGENTAWWDGSDDLLRDPEAARHGVYHIPTRPVAPGGYKVRGLWHRPVRLHYEFSIYNAGQPAWETADKTGCWMTTHTPPTSMVAIPGTRTADGQPLVAMGAYVAEGGHGLQWLREDGTKLGGQGWVGGTWTGAPTLAADAGPQAIAEHACYVGSVWDGELRLTAKTRTMEDKPVFKAQLGADPRINKPGDGPKPPEFEGFDGGAKTYVLAGIAVRDGVIACSMVRQNELLFVDVKSGSIAGRLAVENPRGVAFDASGRMLVLSGSKLLRVDRFTELIQALRSEKEKGSAGFQPVPAGILPAGRAASEKAGSVEERPTRNDVSGKMPETAGRMPALPISTVIAAGLDDPRHVITDADGNFLITDRGAAHQVKIFSPKGKLLRTIGKPGAPAAGVYDPQHLNNPNGLALDSQGRVWVAEADNFPRRVSVWTSKGQLVRAFYGPTEYGGGGVLDARDAARFFYKGMEFRLDWKAGRDELTRVFARPDPLLEAHGGYFSPDTPLYPDARKGARYFTSCYTHNPTSGDHVAFVWNDDGKLAHLVAGLGNANAWAVLRAPEFRAVWPEGTKPEEENPPPERSATFTWTDANGDGRPQPGEVRMVRGLSRGVTVMNDLSFLVARFDGVTARFSPASFDAKGTPSYDLAKAEKLGPAGGPPPSSGGDQALTDPGGWTVNTNAVAPFSPFGLGGTFRGEPRWSYPSAWPGLHASHEAAVPDRPGMVVGHTRLLGGWVKPAGDAGPLFCVNGNMGNMVLFTADGLFVATLFNDIRLRPNWAAPVATRDMDVTDVSLHDENFWPSITQTPDGRVFLVDGGRTSLVRIDGLDSIKRLPEQTINVTPSDLDKAREWFARAETARQKARGSGVLNVPLRKNAPKVDGRLDDWPAATDWAAIDQRGTKANFNSNSLPYEVSAAVCVNGDRLFAAWRTTEKDLLTNSGETPNALFKTGGCLDLMLGADAKAAPDRAAPVAGDVRLLVTTIKGQARALLYRAKVAGAAPPVSFSSPWRSIAFDAVEDVTAQVALASDGAGNYEISIPLATLHWQPKAGEVFRADLGVLRGSNFQTTQRIYWSNKATAITADVPSEAELTPKLWGKWRISTE